MSRNSVPISLANLLSWYSTPSPYPHIPQIWTTQAQNNNVVLPPTLETQGALPLIVLADQHSLISPRLYSKRNTDPAIP